MKKLFIYILEFIKEISDDILSAILLVTVIYALFVLISDKLQEDKTLEKQKLELEIQNLKNRIALDTLLIHREREFYHKRNANK